MPKRQPPALRGVLLLIFSLVLSGSLSLAATTPEEKSPAVETSARPASAKTSGMKGIASYYAKRYQGRRTHSGERYDSRKMTAAHPDLPLGTKVIVRNLQNDQEVVVTVNDRCRKKKHPFIDLSREAARRLGFLGKGIARVVITPLTDRESES